MPNSSASSSRDRRARASSLAALVARFVSIGVSFATIPLTQGHLGPERFGLWITVTSFVAMLSFADLGIGNTILSKIARARSLGDTTEVNTIISTAAFVLISLGATTAVAGIWAAGAIDIATVFKVSDTSVQLEFSQTLRIFALMFGLNIATAWITRVQMAFQRGHLESASTALGALFGLGWIAAALPRGVELPGLLAGYLGGSTLAIALVGLYFIRSEWRVCLPRISSISKPSVRGILSGGMLFVALQASGAAAFASDSFILTARLGPAEAGDFSIVSKLYGSILILINIYITPLWPAYADANAKSESTWIAKTLRSSTIICVLSSVAAGAVLTLSYEWVTTLWLGEVQKVSIQLLVLMTLWISLVSAGAAGSMFLNGLQIYRFQITCALCLILVMLPAKWLLVPTWGVGAIPIAGAAAFLITTVIPYCWFIPRKLRGAK